MAQYRRATSSLGCVERNSAPVNGQCTNRDIARVCKYFWPILKYAPNGHLLFASEVVCLSVCLSLALPNRLNGPRCRFKTDSREPKKPYEHVGACTLAPPGKYDCSICAAAMQPVATFTVATCFRCVFSFKYEI